MRHSPLLFTTVAKLGFGHIPIGLRILNGLGFLILVASLVYSPYMKVDLVDALMKVLIAISAKYWLTLLIASLCVFAFVTYQLGNRLFPLVFSSRWTVGILFIAFLIANPVMGYVTLFISSISYLVALWILPSSTPNNIAASNICDDLFDDSDMPTATPTLDDLAADLMDGYSAYGITRR